MAYTAQTLYRACQGRDRLRRERANAQKPFIVQWCKKNGEPSRMHDATYYYDTEEEARRHIGYWRAANPKTLRFRLNGEEV